MMRNSVKVLMILILLSACTKGGGGSDGPGTDACSVVGLNPRIINGTECASGAAPIVFISLERSDGTFACSGTMLTPTSVLTAAHCVAGRVVRAQILGGSTLSVLADVADIIVHPNSTVQPVTNRFLNDAAVLRLDRAVSLPTLPVIASSRVQKGDIVSIFGFGQTEVDRGGRLESGEMEITEINELGIFANFSGAGSNTCFGDSGGPALITTRGRNGETVTGIIGITSSGDSPTCGEGDVSFFTDVQGDSLINFLTSTVPGVRLE